MTDAKMTETEKRIEAVKLLHELRREGEATGEVFLRGLRALKSLPSVERIRDEWCDEYTALRDGKFMAAPTALQAEVREKIARTLYECEKRRATNADSVIKHAFPKASDALLMEPWEECCEVFLSDADAILASLPVSHADVGDDAPIGMREALQIIADWQNVRIADEHEHSLRDIIRSITDCADRALNAAPTALQAQVHTEPAYLDRSFVRKHLALSVLNDMSTAAILDLLLGRINWDGMDPNTFTIAEIRRAIPNCALATLRQQGAGETKP